MQEGVRITAVSVEALMTAPGLSALLDEYAAEAKSPELPEAQPQWAQYKALESAGLLAVFAAHDGQKLIGFAAALRGALPHYGGHITAVESVFVAKAYRHTGAGVALIRRVEKLAADHATSLLITAPANSALATILPRMGYRHSNSVFVKAA